MAKESLCLVTARKLLQISTQSGQLEHFEFVTKSISLSVILGGKCYIFLFPDSRGGERGLWETYQQSLPIFF